MKERDIQIINQLFIEHFQPYISVGVKHIDVVEDRYIGVTDDPKITLLFPPILDAGSENE